MSIGGLDMRRIALVGVPALAVTSVAVTPAYAASPPPSADLRMTYGNPQIAQDNSGVTWHWVLTNNGAADADGVVATHRVSADQKIVGISQPCTGAANDVVCRFGAIKPGERQSGWIKTAVAKPGGTLRVNAQVTWRENPSVLPNLPDQPTLDAGAPSGKESWGVSRTDAATDLPGRPG
jgi:Domain of unknown function DUF11